LLTFSSSFYNQFEVKETSLQIYLLAEIRAYNLLTRRVLKEDTIKYSRMGSSLAQNLVQFHEKDTALPVPFEVPKNLGF